MYLLSVGILLISLLSVRRVKKIKTYSLDTTITNQLKGVSILFVILGHLNIEYYEWEFMRPFGTIGVTLFLFISGYGLVKSYQKNGLANFAEKRIKNVYFPYFIITTVWLIIDFFTNQPHSVFVGVISLLGLDFTRSVDATMWYITFIFYWYSAFYFVFKMIKKDWLKVITLSGFSVLSVIIWAMNLLGDASYQWVIHSLSFPIGTWYAIYGENLIQKNKSKLLLPTLFLSVIVYIGNFSIREIDSLYVMIADISGMVVIISIFMMLRKKGIKFHFLESVGRYSYELYLVEGYLIDKVIKSGFGQNQNALFIYVIAVIIAATILKKAIWIYKLVVEKKESIA